MMNQPSQRKLQDLQQEAYSCDQLEKLLKFQVRTAASFQSGLTVAQIVFMLINPEIYAVTDRVAFIVLQLITLALAGYGVYFSFKEMEIVAKTEATYYQNKDSKSIILMFIVSLMVACTLVAMNFSASLSMILQSNLDLAGTSLMVDLKPTTLSIYDNKELAVFTFLCLLQTICFGFMAYGYWIFCDTVYRTQSLCCYIFSTISFIAIATLCYNAHNASQLVRIGVLPDPSLSSYCRTMIVLCLFILVCLAFVMLQSFFAMFYQTLRNQIWKFSIGVVLIQATFVLVGLNGLILRDLQQSGLTFVQQCQAFIDLAPEQHLQAAGCRMKYADNPPVCLQLFAWENWPTQEFKCINTNCCQFLTNYFLTSVVDTLFNCYLLTGFLLVLIGMLFHMRRADDSATSQYLKITLGGVIVGFLAMLFLYWVVPVSIPPHKPVLTTSDNYIPSNDVQVIQAVPFSSQTLVLNKQTFGCNPMTVTPAMELVLQTESRISFALTLQQGYFLLADVNPSSVLMDLNCQLPGVSASDCIVFTGTGNSVLSIVKTSISLCLTSVVPQLGWGHRLLHGRKHISSSAVTVQRSNAQSQATLSSYMSFVNVSVDLAPHRVIDLYDSLVLECSVEVRSTPKFMSLTANSSGGGVFYNYPGGAYGTIVATDHSTTCMGFQAYGNLDLQPKTPPVQRATFTAQWSSTVDMDLLVYFAYDQDDFCLVGSKASKRCGLMSAGPDSMGGVGNAGEWLVSTEIGQYDYLIFVRSQSFKASLVLYVYIEGSSFPVETIRVDQSQAQSDTWVGACLLKGQKLKVVNQFDQSVIPNPSQFCF